MSPVPVSKVIGGSLFVHDPDGMHFILNAQHFALNINLGDWGSIPVDIAVGYGTTVNVSAKLSGSQTLHKGNGDYALKLYPTLWFAGMLQFMAPPIAIPNTPMKSFHETGSFTFKGHLLAYTADPNVNLPPPLFEYNIGGKGHVSVRMQAWSPQALTVTSVLYTFEPF